LTHPKAGEEWTSGHYYIPYDYWHKLRLEIDGEVENIVHMVIATTYSWKRMDRWRIGLERDG
jgi:hypothetical protein